MGFNSALKGLTTKGKFHHITCCVITVMK